MPVTNNEVNKPCIYV